MNTLAETASYTELHLSAFIICVKPWYTDTFGGFSKAPRRRACHQLMGRPQNIYFSGVLFLIALG